MPAPILLFGKGYSIRNFLQDSFGYTFRSKSQIQAKFRDKIVDKIFSGDDSSRKILIIAPESTDRYNFLTKSISNENPPVWVSNFYNIKTGMGENTPIISVIKPEGNPTTFSSYKSPNGFYNWINQRTASKIKNPIGAYSKVYTTQNEGMGVIARVPDGSQIDVNNGGVSAHVFHQSIVSSNQWYSLDFNLNPPIGGYGLVMVDDINKANLGGPGNLVSANRNNPKWNYGAFYAHDANPDARAYLALKDRSGQIYEDAWFAPYGYQAVSSDKGMLFKPNNTDSETQEVTSANYGALNTWINYPGNPFALKSNEVGLGAGLHVDYKPDEINGKPYNDGVYQGLSWGSTLNQATNQNWDFPWSNKLGNPYGEGSYSIASGGGGEVSYADELKQNGWAGFTAKYSTAVKDYFGSLQGSYVDANGLLLNQGNVDTAMPWVNNMRDLLQMQNRMYKNKANLLSDPSPENYWGWSDIATQPEIWDSLTGLAIMMPLDKQGSLAINSNPERDLLVERLDKYFQPGGGYDYKKDQYNELPIVIAQTLPRGVGDQYQMTYVDASNLTLSSYQGLWDIKSGVLTVN